MTNKTILLIEDDAGISEALLEVLSDEGYQTIHAANGKEALEYLNNQKNRPDLILLDLMMPVMDGYTFRQEQLKDHSISEIPVVVLTAGGLSPKLNSLQVAATLRKPINLDQLFETIQRYC